MSKKDIYDIPPAKIVELGRRDYSQLWKPKAVHVATRSDLAPGFDIVALLENTDGILDELRIILGVTGEPNTPGIVQQRGSTCRLSILWNKIEIVDCVLLSFKSQSCLSSLFLQLVSAFSHIASLDGHNRCP